METKTRGNFTICVCTSYTATAEPRAPRHAAALAKAWPDYRVVFIDCVPLGGTRVQPPVFECLRNLEYKTCFYDHKRSSLARLAWAKLRQFVHIFVFAVSGRPASIVLSVRAETLEKAMKSVRADLYVSHNIDALLPMLKAAGADAFTVFDSMEFHSRMGDKKIHEWMVDRIEKNCLPKCGLVLASSDAVADALEKKYCISKPLPIYNKPPIYQELPPKESGFSIYWRNSTISVSRDGRGLKIALAAMARLPEDVSLHVQGSINARERKNLSDEIERLKLQGRIVVHPAHLPQEAVLAASRYRVGLCPEKGADTNNRLTVSNKIFDYMMGELAVVASDLPGLRRVIETSRGGLLFRAGDPADLAEKIMLLYRDPLRLEGLARNARRFALDQGNQEHEMRKLVCAVVDLLKKRKG